YNDEIWSSFYTNNERTSALPVFKSAWNYFQSLASHCFDINRTKITWINQHAKWINSLEQMQDKTEIIKDAIYNLSYTHNGNSLYEDVISKLPINPKSIKIIAPYYNR